MKESEARVKTPEQGVSRSLLRLLICSLHNRFYCLDVDICQFLQPEIVQAHHHLSELVVLEALISVVDSTAESSEDPLVSEAKFHAWGVGAEFLRHESLGEVSKGKFHDVPQFVAELTIAHDSLHIQVNAVLDHVGE